MDMSLMFQDLFMPTGKICSILMLIWWLEVMVTFYGVKTFLRLLSQINWLVLQALGNWMIICRLRTVPKMC
uniref:Uncharacterized protein n=1 Tax=Rhizophora mucronata TaxID=61149 RepID=A0A2P2N787_RHIMU